MVCRRCLWCRRNQQSKGLVGPSQHPRSNVWLYTTTTPTKVGWLPRRTSITKQKPSSKAQAEGRPYLGVPLGTEEYAQSFLSNKVKQWSEELNLLATIAHTQPHAAYAAFTHGMMSKWSYLSRSMMDASICLHPIEHTIRTKLIPALMGRSPPNDIERDLLALPACLGGIALANPSSNRNRISHLEQDHGGPSNGDRSTRLSVHQ